jgi:predicted lactoylglutathione lyase
MKKSIWFNLPVLNIERSKTFFEALGVSFSKMETTTMIGLEFGDEPIRVMLFEHQEFERFTQSTVADVSTNAELLISMEAATKEEVDQLAEKVRLAGGSIFAGPELWQGWMYGMGFQDLDGHRWNIAFMDWEKMPKENV